MQIPLLLLCKVQDFELPFLQEVLVQDIYIPPFVRIKTPEHWDRECKRALCKLSGTKAWINTEGKSGTRAKNVLG